MRKSIIVGLVSVLVLCFALAASALGRADKTSYPVVFMHGMLGFDQLLGIHYWGDDYGTFVGDPCDSFFETSCNAGIDRRQQAFAIAVSPLASSEKRGAEAADQIESYMATVGAAKVNLVGHSQGGLDARKVAKVLYERKGYQVVKVLVSISSPHRGSPIAKSILERDDGVTQFGEWVMNYIGAPLIYGEEGDLEASLKAFNYDDADPNDGMVTGAKAFNEKYGIDNTYIGHYASVITADEKNTNPILALLASFSPDKIDADGWCGPENEDCDDDGAAGAGDGDIDDGDDDGLVGINSQQMGYRLAYTEGWFSQKVEIDKTLGYVADINRPNELQSTSKRSILKSDHLDLTGLGIIPFLLPDAFNEKEYFAAVIDYIADHE